MTNWLPLLAILIGSIALGVLALSWGHRQKSHAPSSPDRQILRYGNGPKAMVVVLGLLLPAVSLYLYSSGKTDANLTIVVLAMTTLIVAYCAPEFFMSRIEFDTKRVYAYSPWRKPRVIPWSVIMACKYSAIKHWHTFDTFGYGALRISDFMDGKDAFVAQFRKFGQECVNFTQAQSAT